MKLTIAEQEEIRDISKHIQNFLTKCEKSHGATGLCLELSNTDLALLLKAIHDYLDRESKG